MHYAFDRWISIKYPKNPWERYADDGIIHCRSKEQAYYLLKKLKERMKECGLEINEEKTNIIYCGQVKGKDEQEEKKFNFLGYTFQYRLCRTKAGKYFRGFTPAVSKEASKAIRKKCREIRLREKTATPEELAKEMNPVIRGWLNYFTKYSPSEARKEMRTLNETLVLWFRRKYKSLRQSKKKARRAMYKWYMAKPDLFYHWKIGVVPTLG